MLSIRYFAVSAFRQFDSVEVKKSNVKSNKKLVNFLVLSYNQFTE